MLKSVVKLNSGCLSTVFPNRARSTLAEPSTTGTSDGTVDHEWINALPYEKIPRLGLLQMLRKFTPGGRYHDVSFPTLLKRYREDYGDLMVLPGILGRSDLVMSFNPDDFRKIFRSEGQCPVRRTLPTFEYYRKHVRPDLFKEMAGLPVDQGEKWHHFRSIANPVLARSSERYTNKLDEIAKEFVDAISKIRDQNNEMPSDFYKWINRWGLESIMMLALDTRLGVLKQKVPNENANIIKCVCEIFRLIYQLDFEPSIWKYYKTPKFNRMMEVLDELTNIIMSKINEAAQRIEKNPSRSNDIQSVFEELWKLDRHVAIVATYDMFFPGVDSVSSAVVGILYNLARNPNKQALLREELRGILPTKHSALTPENMRNLPYLRACIKEGLRMYSPAVGHIRTTGKDLVLQGYRVPKETNMLMAAMALHQDEQFVARGKEFLPERWLKDTKGCPSGKDVHPFLVLPFGFGPRACIAKRMALLEIEIVIARITRHFEYRWNYKDIKILGSFVNVPVDEMKFQMVDVDY